MIKLTQLLKDWLVENCEAAKDASDDTFRELAGKAIADGTLGIDKLTELTADPDAGKASDLESKMDDMVSGFKGLTDTLQKGFAALGGAGSDDTAKGGDAKDVDGDQKDTTTADPDPKPEDQKDTAPKDKKGRVPSAIEQVLAGSDGIGLKLDDGTRVKGAWEGYETSTKDATYPRECRGVPSRWAGRPVRETGSEDGGVRTVQELSELQKAASGAYLKWVICNSAPPNKQPPRGLRMTQHDKELLQWTFENAKWGGVINGGEIGGSENMDSIALHNRKLRGEREVKALIDDTITGGLEAAPIFFDDAVILDPLLHGELFPKVNVVNITRGRRIEGAKFANVTVQWGGGDKDPIDLFDTTAYVTAFDTLIHVVDGAIEIGLDFMDDSPIRVMEIVQAQYSERLLETLDEQIAVGDGAQEPEGIMNAASTNLITSSGSHTVGFYERLLFGVAKRFKQSQTNDTMCFCSTEQSYQRARGIPVASGAVSVDERRVFGLDQSDYQLFGHPFSINEPMTNTRAFYGLMRRYRMYRRLGLTVRTTTEGKELVRNNAWMISARARFGGQVEDPAAFAVCRDLPV